MVKEYIKGDVITSIDKAVSSKFVFVDGALYDAKSFGKWHVDLLMSAIRKNEIREAIEKKKTIMEDFFEKYPNAPVSENGEPNLCPSQIGYKDHPNEKTRAGYCANSANCYECWNQPLPEKEGQQ